MFTDKSDIYIKAGNGGNGCVSFHREKYVAKGGPDGGDGGKGGSVIFVVDSGENTLIRFKYKHKFVAANGEDGKPEKFHGKNAPDLVIPVPPGTLIKDKATGKIIFDMGKDKTFVAAKGGRGGWGNVHFATPTRQIPRFAKSGTPGGERELTLELKMLADVGLVGFPNVGKSTLLSVCSYAKPKIANYHFTTLSPMLGVVTPKYGRSFVMSDIPGLIEGASDGAGLGLDFLRHIDRCRLLIHVIDASGSEGRDPIDDISLVNRELFKYSEELLDRPQIICANKSDMIEDESVKEELKAYCAELGYEIVFISALNRLGVDELIDKVSEMLKDMPPLKEYEPEIEEKEPEPEDRTIRVTKQDGVFIVESEWLERFINNLYLTDRESYVYFERVLKKEGVYAALEEAGIQDGDTVSIYDVEFDYVL
ncbi:MAG: GTPase ObgE [Ruminococcaceae bacterium]|nr:GTPase ObgE [Oscillospiraceae bacterium]